MTFRPDTDPHARGFTRGIPFERAAESWLASQGLELVARNFRARGGEIDLVMRDATTLVFVEVRRRTRRRYGSALESITAQKVSRIRRAAEIFLKTRNFTASGQHPSCRFDVVTFDGADDALEVQWIRNAF